MAEDEGARGDVPLRVGVVHPGLRWTRRLLGLPVAQAPAHRGPRPRPAAAPPEARRGRGIAVGRRRRSASVKAAAGRETKRFLIRFFLFGEVRISFGKKQILKDFADLFVF